MERGFHGDIECIAGASSDNRFPKWILQAISTGSARNIFVGGDNAVNSVIDASIASTSAQIALESSRQVSAFLIIESGRCHNHTRGAEATLKRLCIKERLLH